MHVDVVEGTTSRNEGLQRTGEGMQRAEWAGTSQGTVHVLF